MKLGFATYSRNGSLGSTDKSDNSDNFFLHVINLIKVISGFILLESKSFLS